jgi:hypothetical protein
MDFCAREGDYTWEDWRREAKSSHPIRFYIQETLPLKVYVSALAPLEELFYWIRTHTYNRYHIVDLRSPQNYYKWGWIDRDQAMVFACFNLLKDYVEKEMDQICYYSAATEHNPEWDRRELEREIMELYKWWTVERRDHIDNDPNFHHNEDDVSEDTIMLTRLLKIRNTLWS